MNKHNHIKQITCPTYRRQFITKKLETLVNQSLQYVKTWTDLSTTVIFSYLLLCSVKWISWWQWRERWLRQCKSFSLCLQSLVLVDLHIWSFHFVKKFAQNSWCLILLEKLLALFFSCSTFQTFNRTVRVYYFCFNLTCAQLKSYNTTRLTAIAWFVNGYILLHKRTVSYTQFNISLYTISS